MSPGPFMLSRAELPVVLLASDGLSNQEIAAELHLSIDTVKAHLRRVAQRSGSGERYAIVGRALLAGLIERREPPVGIATRVTRRRHEVLGQIARGQDTEGIARALRLSENTVKTHIRHLLKQFKARNRAHLLRLAFDAGVLEIVPRRRLGRAA